MRALTTLALVLVLGAFAAPAYAGDGKGEKAREKARNLTPEQKEKLRERLREKWQSLTPEQQEKLKERLREKRGK